MHSPNHDDLNALMHSPNHDDVYVLEPTEHGTYTPEVSLEMVYYDQYYRRRGIRTYQLFAVPRFSNEEVFELPRSGLVHYIPESQLEVGIAPTHILLRKAPGVIMAQHVEELTTTVGSPRRLPVPADKIKQQYRAQYRKIRPIKNIETALRDERTILVMNYGILNHTVRYRNVFQSRLFRFQNMINTWVDKVNELAEITDRQQYLAIRLPKVIPSKAQFIRGAQSLNRQTLQMFGDDQALFLLEFWKWLSKHRDRSLFARLSDKALDKLNLVVTESGKFTFFNLGLLNSWRNDPDEPGGTGKDPAQMQIDFLRFLEAGFTIRSVAAKSTISVTIDETDEESDVVEEEMTGATIDGEEIEELSRLEDEAYTAEEVVDDYDDQGALLQTTDDEQVTFIPVDETDDLIDPPVESDLKITQGVERASEELLSEGLISHAEHRRYERLAASYEKIPNPFGEGTLADHLLIDPEVVNVVPTTEYEPKDTVFDKSMLKTTLDQFTSTYVDKVMSKDVANMVLSAQNAGIAITDYRVEKVVDANNKYQIHTVRLTPVGGAPSTFTFRLPTIEKDGTYLAGGVKYRMRMQRSDIPIRKVSSTKVGLTSYYSKLFVVRSERRVNDYGQWLLRQFIDAVENNPDIDVTAYGNVFDRYLKAPRTYSALARRYKGMRFKDYPLIFDHHEARKRYGNDLIEYALSNQEMIVGEKSNAILVMSDAGVLYTMNAKSRQAIDVLGTIEELVGVDTSKAPVEIAEIDVMGKMMPVGIVLAYRMGLSNLIRYLKADYRQVARGARMDLTPDEYVIRMADQTLIFNRQQRLPAMILGSINRYHRSVKLYEYEEFDSKDVYGAILEREGLGVRYAREIENMYALYIDHITEELLQQMNEPTTFGPLIIRATEMLLTDEYPDETDGNYMRVKGYERMAGAVYQELIKGIRRQKARPLTAKSTVDINPNSVWMAIQQDPSVSIVEETNPIQFLKEQENTTFSGVGGRSSRTMVRRTRAFHENDLGMISEATVDNSDVAVTAYTSANPKLSTLRGIPSKDPIDFDNAAGLVSTSMLLTPSSDRDD